MTVMVNQGLLSDDFNPEAGTFGLCGWYRMPVSPLRGQRAVGTSLLRYPTSLSIYLPNTVPYLGPSYLIGRYYLPRSLNRATGVRDRQLLGAGIGSPGDHSRPVVNSRWRLETTESCSCILIFSSSWERRPASLEELATWRPALFF